MDEEGLRKEIYNNMQLLETEDLIEIWRKNDQKEWTPAALEAVEQVLNKRLGAFWSERITVEDVSESQDQFDSAEEGPELEEDQQLSDNEIRVQWIGFIISIVLLIVIMIHRIFRHWLYP